MLLRLQDSVPSVADRILSDPIPLDRVRSLCGLLLERARRTPHSPAYTHFEPATGRWTTRTWSEVRIEVGRWQAALRGEGLTPGDRVAVMLANRPEWAYFDLAALGLGLVTVPLYPNDRPESIRHLLADSGARLLLMDSRAAAAAPGGIERILILDTENKGDTDTPGGAIPVTRWLPDRAGPPRDAVTNPDGLATIVYTSGTTGAPKGAMLTHRNLLWNASASLARVPTRRDDRFLSFLPLSHTLERTAGHYLPIMAGIEVVYARSIPDLPEDLRLHRPTVLIAVPRIFERVYSKVHDKLAAGPVLSRWLFERAVATGWARFQYRQGRGPWTPQCLLAPVLDYLVGRRLRERLGGRLRVAVCGGAPLSPEIARTFLALGVPLVQGYGLTEASPVISVNTLEDNIPESVGLPLPDVELRLGRDDELQVRSPGVMLGYWRQPRATAAVIDPKGWLHTGDQARIADGHLFITGRIKEILVLSTGEKVSPVDLEGAILGDSLFSQVVVIGEGRPYLAALAVLDDQGYGTLTAGEDLPEDLGDARQDRRLERMLLERIDRRLKDSPGYAKIRRVATVEGPWSIEEGLMTPTMKMRRAQILARYREAVEQLYAGHG